ncbi:MAG: hypothetical protein IKG86_09785 [Paludibacteraceae bacterium]|nr:hypothetical protein [Paludibacteraceae bacterium]
MKNLFIIIATALVLVGCGSQKALTEAEYTQEVQQNVPFRVSKFKPVKPDVYSFRCDRYVDWLPDYEVNDEGAMMIWRTTFSQSHTTQPAQYIWRNIVIDRRNNRILCIDRVLKDGLTQGYVYVLQSETRKTPNGFHWDVTEPRHMLLTASILQDQTELSVELLKIVLQEGK